MIKTKLLNITILLGIIFILPFNVFADTDIYLGLKRKGKEKIAVAVVDLEPKDKGQFISYVRKEVTAILNSDLRLSGFFKPVKNRTFIDEVVQIDKKVGNIVFAEWGRIGAQAIIKGDYSFADGKLVISFRMYNVMERKLILHKKYQTKMKGLRKAVHMFADEVINILTGVPGIATSKIAFVSRHRKHKELYVIDYDGYNLRRVTSDRSIVLSPAWSPDGKKISYTSYKKGNPDLYTVSLKRRIKKRILHKKGLNTTPDWSMDGRYIAVTLSKDKNSEIYRYDVKKKALKRITNNRAIDTSPSWSPDGKRIAFVSDRTGRPQVYVMDSNGRNVERITFYGKESHTPSWSPDGKKIAYTCRQKSYFDIYIYDIEKKTTEKLTENSGNNENPAWSADNRHIVFQSNRAGTNQIYMMNLNGDDEHMVVNMKGGGFNPSWSPRF